MDAELTMQLKRIEDLTRIGAKNVLSVKEAALMLGKSEKTLRNNADKYPHYYGPEGIVFRKDELESWMCQVHHAPITALR